LLVVDHRHQVLMVENHLAGRELAAVNDGRNLAATTQAAARTLALIVTEVRLDLESDAHGSLLRSMPKGTSATRGSPPKTRSVDVEPAHRLLIANATNGFREQSCHRELADAAALARRLRQRNRVGHDELVERRR